MQVDLSVAEIDSIVSALRFMFSEQPSTVLDEERALLARLEAMVTPERLKALGVEE